MSSSTGLVFRKSLTASAHSQASGRQCSSSIAEEAALGGLTSRESTDYAITLLELFAAAGDVLTFYSERIANELFLRTARERDSLLRLLRLIGYRLRPGLAAQTLLSFTLDAGAETRIRKGLKVMSVPGQEEKPQIFETIEQIIANAEINEAAAYAPPLPFNGFALGGTGGAIVARPAKLSAGDRLLCFGRGSIEEKTVAAIISRSDGEQLITAPPIEAERTPGNSRLVKLEGRLRFFGHNAPKNVHVFVPPPPQGFPSWQVREIDPSLNPPDAAYPLDGRYTGISAGEQLLIQTSLCAPPTLRTASSGPDGGPPYSRARYRQQ